MKFLFKKILKSKYKYLYIVIALIIIVAILKFIFDIIFGLPGLIIKGVILFIPVVFIAGFVMSVIKNK